MGVVVNDGCSSPCFISTGTEERVMGGLEGKPPGSWMKREREMDGGRKRVKVITTERDSPSLRGCV